MSLRYLIGVFLSVLIMAVYADAKPAHHRVSHSTHSKPTKQNLFRPRTSVSLVADATTGKVLHTEGHHTIVHPASLTKMMTLYVLFDEIEKKHINMNTMLSVSKKATAVIPLKLWLKPGQKISVADAIMGIIVHSANDASVVVAEALGGTEKAFARKMNATAKKLGMSNTHFVNSSGLPDHRQVTTAADMAKLGLALKRDHPKFYPLFKKTSFVFNGKVIKSHNGITKNYPGAEGMKTGYTNASGCNLVTTASRGKKSLIAVVIGADNRHSRDGKMAKLLDRHFGVASVDYDQVSSSRKVTNKKNSKAKTIRLASAKSGIKKRSTQRRV